jgi:hypothetical protein
MKGKILVCISLILGMAGTLPAGSFLDIQPGMVELSVPAGQTIKGHFLIANPNPEPLQYNIEVEDGWLQQVGKPSSVAPQEWFFLKIPKKRTIRPNGNKKIPYRIKAPSQLNGEVLVLVFYSAPPEPGPSQSVGIQYRHGIPVYLSAKGTEKGTLSVKKSMASFTPEGGVTISVNLGLEGNAHVRPRGEWIITDFFGQEVERIPLDYGMPIFPGAGRDYTARSRRGRWVPGSYKALLSVTYGEQWGALQTFEKTFGLQVTEDKLALMVEPAHAP